MNMTDPIADKITRIRNGVRARLPKIDVPASRLKTEIARILKDEGYIANFRLIEDGRQGGQGAIRIFLRYGPGWERVITDLQRVYARTANFGLRFALAIIDSLATRLPPTGSGTASRGT